MQDRQYVHGLSQKNRDIADEFDTKATIIGLLSEIKVLIEDPKAFDVLAKAAVTATALTEDEKKERNEAVETIATAKKSTNDLYAFSKEMDQKAELLKQETEDAKQAIKDMEASTRESLDQTRNDILKLQKALDGTTAEIKAKHQAEWNRLADLEKSLVQKDAELNERTKHLSDYERDLSDRQTKVADRERLLLGNK